MINFVESEEDYVAFSTWIESRIKEQLPIALDTETSGLHPEHDIVRLIQFSSDTEAFALDFQHYEQRLQHWLFHPAAQWILHNAKFDIRFICHEYNVSTRHWNWKNTTDTMVLAHLQDSQQSKGLKPLAKKYIQGGGSDSQQKLHDLMSENKWTWATIPLQTQEYWAYGCLDTIYTYQYFLQVESLRSLDSYGIEMKALECAADMESIGIKVDLDYTYEQIDKIDTYTEQAREWFTSLGVKKPSPQQLWPILRAHGAIPERFTVKGSPALDKEVLKSLATNDNETVKAIATTLLDLRKCEKISKSYLHNVTDKHVKGRVHASINPLQALTGRMSITSPALQTLPAGSGVVRKCFVPDEGKSLITCDFDQIEARLMAHFSQDQGLIDAFHSDVDFFCHVASGIYGESIERKDPRRGITKSVVYGGLYGAGVAKRAETAGVSFEQMKHAVDHFNSAYPSVLRFQNRVADIAHERRPKPYVLTPFGKKLYAHKDKAYALVNYLIQGTAAELFKAAMGKVYDLLPPESLLLPVHDELVMQVPTEEAEDYARRIEEVMKIEGFAVPITAGADILHHSWGEKY